MLKIILAHIIGCVLLSTIASGSSFALDYNYAFNETDAKLEKLQIYFETEMYEKAASLLDELIGQNPDEPRFTYLKAIVDYQSKDYEPAQKTFEQFIKEYPQTPEPYYFLGEINLQKGNVEEARRYFREYCQLVPEDMEAQQKLIILSNNVNPDSISVIKDGQEDKQLVKNVGYYGGCVHTQDGQAIKLIHGSFRTWSSMGIDFAYPLDLRGKQILLKLKGKRGGERLSLTFRDRLAQDYIPQLVIYPEEKIDCDWQQLKISLPVNQTGIDLSCLVHMGIEFGFSTVQNPPNTTIFVKDIIIEDAVN